MNEEIKQRIIEFNKEFEKVRYDLFKKYFSDEPYEVYMGKESGEGNIYGSGTTSIGFANINGIPTIQTHIHYYKDGKQIRCNLTLSSFTMVDND